MDAMESCHSKWNRDSGRFLTTLCSVDNNKEHSAVTIIAINICTCTLSHRKVTFYDRLSAAYPYKTLVSTQLNLFSPMSNDHSAKRHQQAYRGFRWRKGSGVEADGTWGQLLPNPKIELSENCWKIFLSQNFRPKVQKLATKTTFKKDSWQN